MCVCYHLSGVNAPWVIKHNSLSNREQIWLTLISSALEYAACVHAHIHVCTHPHTHLHTYLVVTYETCAVHPLSLCCATEQNWLRNIFHLTGRVTKVKIAWLIKCNRFTLASPYLSRHYFSLQHEIPMLRETLNYCKTWRVNSGKREEGGSIWKMAPDKMDQYVFWSNFLSHHYGGYFFSDPVCIIVSMGSMIVFEQSSTHNALLKCVVSLPLCNRMSMMLL